jgi:hypothetical protein
VAADRVRLVGAPEDETSPKRKRGFGLPYSRVGLIYRKRYPLSNQAAAKGLGKTACSSIQRRQPPVGVVGSRKTAGRRLENRTETIVLAVRAGVMSVMRPNGAQILSTYNIPGFADFVNAPTPLGSVISRTPKVNGPRSTVAGPATGARLQRLSLPLPFPCSPFADLAARFKASELGTKHRNPRSVHRHGRASRSDWPM